ncbi:MAG: parallel beta-helix domain-containing protein [Myxococcota bacterium]|nr:parallel beta-helix domain-containing protein [Myxococcota bacterium]
MRNKTWILGLALAVWGCDGGEMPGFENVDCDDFDTANCVRVEGGDSQGLLDAVNTIDSDTTIVLGEGTFDLSNQVTIRGVNDINLVGQGIDVTVLAFTSATAQINGIDVVADNFLVQDLTVLDAPKDGIRVEDSDGVTYRRIKATWSEPGLMTNGAYGIYPVRSRNVLVEESIAERSSDAGLYVGQCINVIVRNNVVRENVAGLEIENTQYADVYDNLAENNTAGIVTFDLPGNPIVGRDVRLRDNMIINNNHPNFAPGGTVALIPPGTGTFALASRRVEITGNTYMNNKTGDIAILSGAVIEEPSVWELDTASLVGDWEDLGLLEGETPGTITNFRTENVVIANNTHEPSTERPEPHGDFGVLIAFLFTDRPSASVLYDALGETFSEDATMHTNNNHICVGGNTEGDFASLNVTAQLSMPGSPILLLDSSDFGPFGCDSIMGDPIQVPTDL